MMTRPQCSVCLERAIRFVKQFTYYESLGQEAEFLDSEEDLPMLTQWMDDIQVFLRNFDSDGLVKRVRQMPSLDVIIAVSNRKKTKVSAYQRTQLGKFASSAESLLALCEEKHKENKGVYRDLPDPIANEAAARLLYRAVHAGYLDPFYKPMPGTTIQQLKLIAFAVGKLQALKHRERWVVFERMWNLGNKGRLGCLELPTRHMEQFSDVIELYPEVDYNDLTLPDFSLRFKSSASDDKIKELYKNLIKARYIANDTTLAQFRGIFGRSSKKLPVVWIQDQASLAYFVYLAFVHENKNVWAITAGSFIVNDDTPTKSAMQAYMNKLKKEDKLMNYDVELYDMVYKYKQTQ